MKFVKATVSILVLAAVTAAFFGVPYCSAACKFQPGPSYWFVGVLALTLLWGRFFCEALCPLGILQSLVNLVFHPKRHVRRVCSRLPATPARNAVRFSVLALFVGAIAAGIGSAWMISPYAIYGKALVLMTPGLVLLGVVLVSAAVGRGRLWCNWVCPFGTAFDLLSKVAWRKSTVGKGCANCRACFPAAEAESKGASDTGVTRRETLNGLALVATAKAGEKLTDGGYSEVSLFTRGEREKTVLPPGAGVRRVFERRCVGCELCVTRCPAGCLSASTNWRTFGQPEMDFRKGHCLVGCTTCGEVCPAGALERLDRAAKAQTHVGVAKWRRDRCIRTTSGVMCTACLKKCPVGAIHLVEGFPVVDAEKCLGCGACEHVCPARPEPAMVVVGLDEQRIVRPVGEADLIAEMLVCLEKGDAIVVAREGVISARERGRGVAPILTLMDRGELKGALVVDRVIGRAAAAACVVGGARRVHAQVMSKSARAFLAAHGIAADAETLVEEIVNRKKTGMCPMEARVMHETDPQKMVQALRAH